MIRTGTTFAALIDEAAAGLWRARRMTIVSVLQIALSIFLVGVFLLAAENMKGLIETVRDETAVTVYLKNGSTPEDLKALETIAKDSRLIAGMRYVSPDEARRRFAGSWPSLSSGSLSLPSNPFPASLELDVRKDAVEARALPALLKNLAAHPSSEEVQFDVEWIRRLRGVLTLAWFGGLALGVALALAAAFTIANVVRLTILLHRDEIEILRMVGAPEILIRGPFLAGGLAQGLLGALLALGILAAAFHGLVRYVTHTHNLLLGVFVIRFLPPVSCALLVVGGLAAGAFGGAIAVRRKNLEA